MQKLNLKLIIPSLIIIILTTIGYGIVVIKNNKIQVKNVFLEDSFELENESNPLANYEIFYSDKTHIYLLDRNKRAINIFNKSLEEVARYDVSSIVDDYEIAAIYKYNDKENYLVELIKLSDNIDIVNSKIIITKKESDDSFSILDTIESDTSDILFQNNGKYFLLNDSNLFEITFNNNKLTKEDSATLVSSRIVFGSNKIYIQSNNSKSSLNLKEVKSDGKEVKNFNCDLFRSDIDLRNLVNPICGDYYESIENILLSHITSNLLQFNNRVFKISEIGNITTQNQITNKNLFVFNDNIYITYEKENATYLGQLKVEF